MNKRKGGKIKIIAKLLLHIMHIRCIIIPIKNKAATKSAVRSLKYLTGWRELL